MRRSDSICVARVPRRVFAIVTASPPITSTEFETLRESLTLAGAALDLPELHGGICGALCAGGSAAASRWLEESLGEDAAHPPLARSDSLGTLVLAIWETLEGTELKFAPLLPDDEAPLEEQVRALALWCHGFLAGLACAAPDLGRVAVAKNPAAPDALVEILVDFSEIGRAGLTQEDAADRDQADFAVAELKEYVRVNVQIVFEELAPRRSVAARDVH